MMRSRILRVVKYGLGSSLLGGSTYLLWRNDWEMSTVGAVRFGRAAIMAAGIVFDYKWTLRNIDVESPDYYDIKSEIHLRSALKLRELCCKNGGTFIKVGQHLSTLDYLLPREYVTTMKVFHSDAPQSPVHDLYRVFEEDLKLKVEDVFESFDPEPLGTASLAQVHRAVTKDGRVLAVKIQHPKVKAHSYVDIRTMEFLIHRVAWVFPDFQYVWLAEETKKNLPLELDFYREGKHCERAGRMFKHFNFLKVPRVYWDLTSERVLTMEYCQGGKVDDLQYMQKHNIDVNEVSRNLGKLYSEMIFVQGYVHCDPHPGNVLVSRTNKGTVITLLDHGLYQSLTNEFRINYSKLWLSILKADMAGIEKYATQLNAGGLYRLFACMLTARSWDSITQGIDRKKLTDQENDELQANASKYMIEISEILNNVPRQLLLIMKTNDVLRSIEFALKTRASASSFLNMSRCCIRALANDELRLSDSWLMSLRIRFSYQFQLCKLGLYEFYLWLHTSSLVQYFMRSTNSVAS